MQLRVTRLCLDCEELHDAQQCPVCASETFAYLTRWVPAPERRSQPRAPVQAQEETSTPRKSSHRAVLGYGVLGIGVVGLTRWFLRGREKIESAGLRGAGDLK